MIATYSGCWIGGIWVCSKNIHAYTSIWTNKLSIALNESLFYTLQSSRVYRYIWYITVRNYWRWNAINMTRCKHIILLSSSNNTAIYFSSIRRNKVKDLIWHFYLVFCIPCIHKEQDCITYLYAYSMRTAMRVQAALQDRNIPLSDDALCYRTRVTHHLELYFKNIYTFQFQSRGDATYTQLYRRSIRWKMY